MDDDTTTMTTLPCPPMSRFVPRRRLAGLSLRWLALVLAGLGLAGPGRANEVSEPVPVPDVPVAADSASLVWSAFGTLGWAQSNRSWRYQRYIDESGGFQRDSVLGAQLDARFTPEWSATLQARLAPSASHESRWDLRTSWAFVGWRPDNDWLVRAGKLRVPFFLRSEQLDVGQTYDEARLPAELYSMAPSSDFTGVHVSRSLDLSDGELSVDAYSGTAHLVRRGWVREGLPPQLPAGAVFNEVDTHSTGLVFTWTAPRAKVRAGAHYVRTKARSDAGFLVRPVWAQLGPGIEYWQTSNALPGPGVETIDSFRNYLFVLGGEFGLPEGWRVSPEVARIMQSDTEMGVDSWGAALTVSREMGRLTPYVSVAMLRSADRSLALTESLESTRVPAAVPGGTMLNATMRAAADRTVTFRQRSWAVGASYSLTPQSKLKAEWLHTRASRSAMFDVPAGESLLTPRSVDVMSISYSFVF